MKIRLSILLVCQFIIACANEPSKNQLDEEVKRLCAIDGGIKIHETVMLPPEKFDEYGNVKITFKELSRSSDEYYIDSKTIFIHRGNPRLVRIHSKIIRSKDGKTMGESTRYGRSGGDLFSSWYESSFNCPSSPSRLEDSVFLREKTPKKLERHLISTH